MRKNSKQSYATMPLVKTTTPNRIAQAVAACGGLKPFSVNDEADLIHARVLAFSACSCSYMYYVLLLKGSQQDIQIGGWPMLALPF